jgi:hypothetical protein
VEGGLSDEEGAADEMLLNNSFWYREKAFFRGLGCGFERGNRVPGFLPSPFIKGFFSQSAGQPIHESTISSFSFLEMFV